MRRLALLLLAATLTLGGCATGTDAVSTGGEFQFVAPGGQTTIRYEPPESRGRLSGLSGESLRDPGRTVGVDDFPGQVVVINIWGSWCGPCRAEMPELQEVFEATRSQGVAFLGIDVRDDRAAAADFLTDRGVTFPSIYDEPGRSLLALRGYPRNVVPSTIVLDREHRVAAVFLTAIQASELQPLVLELATEGA